ncbi:hypothetical protein ACHAXT_007679 [Thalassiosira profunda]
MLADGARGREQQCSEYCAANGQQTYHFMSTTHHARYMQKSRRSLAEDEDEGGDLSDDKAFKICSVLGGLDVTRYVSRDARSLFAGAIDDVELIREVIGETALHGGVGHRMTIEELNKTLDREGRGIDDENVRTTLAAGLSYVDDRPDRRSDFWVGLANLGGNPQRSYNQSTEVNARAELAIVQAASLVFPWIVDRKSKPKNWWVSHQNGRSTGDKREPFRFDSLYSAAWIGSWGEAWAYYPPMNRLAGGQPSTFADPGVGIPPDGSTHELPFVKANLPLNNIAREAMFSKPYADYAQPGDSIITALAPLYFTGTIAGATYDDTYIASLGLDMEVESLSTLLDVLTDRLTKGSFALLVDFDLDVIVISQEVVEKIYPARTGFEDERVTYDLSGEVTGDRRNRTYSVSDTIFEGLAKLDNADWESLRTTLEDVKPGDRDFSKLNITLTGEREATEMYVMFEKWQYVADWALLAFAPVTEVDNAIDVGFVGTNPPSHSAQETHSLNLEVRKGDVLAGSAALRNEGSLDVALTSSGTPSWMRLHQEIGDGHVLRAGGTLDLPFDVLTDDLHVGTTKDILSFHVRDASYPDCFYDEEKGLRVTVNVLPHFSYAWAILVLVIGLGLGLLAIYAYVERSKKEADTMWEVKQSELVYDDPPEVLGRGTFGLVVSAEYRGTKVAVKRVIPPRNSQRRRGSTSGALANSAIFDYDDTSESDDDEEKAEPQDGRVQSKPSAPRESEPKKKLLDSSERSVLSESESKAGARKMYGAVKVSIGMVPGALSGRRSRRTSDLSSSVQSAGDESAPLTGPATSADNGNVSGQMSGHASFGGSRWFGYGSMSRRSIDYLREDFVREMRVLSKLRHPNITTFMGAVIAKEPLLIMECMSRGSLYDLLHNSTMVFEADIVLSILRDVAQGMRFLHSATPQIIHGDLKAANVLVDAKFSAKVTDFGFSIKQSVGASGTPFWMAPELLGRASGNTAASDVYSFGILLYEVYSRRDPYSGEDFDAVIREVCDPAISKRPPVPESMPAEVSSLLYSSCLSADASLRPTFVELDGFLKRLGPKNVDPGEQLAPQGHSSQERRLLDELFPQHVAAALREGRKVEPEDFDCVSIFFSDIVGFTSLSASMTAAKACNLVDRLYDRMDALSHKHGVHKLETIGDAWVGVTNLFSACPDDHAKRIALFAIEASKVASECLVDEEDRSKGFVRLRIGFHSGPATAAVVGTRMPKFSVFGDTINTASRMESNSQPGRIHCSDRSEALLRAQAPEIAVTCRGEINVKGKGEMTTYWVGE